MSLIRSKNTVPELRVRSTLHRAGYRYRLHVSEMPGKPDIVMPHYRTVIFVNGCFWHRHKDCKYATTPKTNTDYWEQKFARTMERDLASHKMLRDYGWKVVIIWECQTRNDQPLLDILAGAISAKGQNSL